MQQIKFVIVICDTKKISYFLPKKTKFPILCVAILFTDLFVLVETVPTERNLATRFSEHSDHKKVRFLSICRNVKTLVCYILNLNHVFDNLNDINDSGTDKPDTPHSFHNLIQANTQTPHNLNTRILTF